MGTRLERAEEALRSVAVNNRVELDGESLARVLGVPGDRQARRIVAKLQSQGVVLERRSGDRWSKTTLVLSTRTYPDIPGQSYPDTVRAEGGRGYDGSSACLVAQVEETKQQASSERDVGLPGHFYPDIPGHYPDTLAEALRTIAAQARTIEAQSRATEALVDALEARGVSLPTTAAPEGITHRDVKPQNFTPLAPANDQKPSDWPAPGSSEEEETIRRWRSVYALAAESEMKADAEWMKTRRSGRPFVFVRAAIASIELKLAKKKRVENAMKLMHALLRDESFEDGAVRDSWREIDAEIAKAKSAPPRKPAPGSRLIEGAASLDERLAQEEAKKAAAEAKRQKDHEDNLRLMRELEEEDARAAK